MRLPWAAYRKLHLNQNNIWIVGAARLDTVKTGVWCKVTDISNHSHTERWPAISPTIERTSNEENATD